MPEYLKHLQGGPESVAAVAVVVVGVLLLQALVLFVLAAWSQQLEMLSTLLLRRSMRSNVASSFQRAIVAWR